MAYMPARPHGIIGSSTLPSRRTTVAFGEGAGGGGAGGGRSQNRSFALHPRPPPSPPPHAAMPPVPKIDGIRLASGSRPTTHPLPLRLRLASDHPRARCWCRHCAPPRTRARTPSIKAERAWLGLFPRGREATAERPKGGRHRRRRPASGRRRQWRGRLDSPPSIVHGRSIPALPRVTPW
jgi:hypothetical protein